MSIPEQKHACLMELQSWQNIIHSEEWVVFRRFLKDHTDYLQKEVNEDLRKGEHIKSAQTLRAMDDANKMLTLITQRITALTKKGE